MFMTVAEISGNGVERTFAGESLGGRDMAVGGTIGSSVGGRHGAGLVWAGHVQ